MSEDKILYRGEEIDVGRIRENLTSFKNNDRTPWFTPSELEAEIQKQILTEKRMIGRLTRTRYEKNQGYRLAFYLKEQQTFPEAYRTKVSDVGARIIVSKLLQHFHGLKLAHQKRWELLGKVHLRFWGNGQSGSAGRRQIRLSHNPSIGIICHEVAHVRIRKHNKKLMRLIKKMVNYCKKKNYWKEEITRRVKL